MHEILNLCYKRELSEEEEKELDTYLDSLAKRCEEDSGFKMALLDPLAIIKMNYFNRVISSEKASDDETIFAATSKAEIKDACKAQSVLVRLAKAQNSTVKNRIASFRFAPANALLYLAEQGEEVDALVANEACSPLVLYKLTSRITDKLKESDEARKLKKALRTKNKESIPDRLRNCMARPEYTQLLEISNNRNTPAVSLELIREVVGNIGIRETELMSNTIGKLYEIGQGTESDREPFKIGWLQAVKQFNNIRDCEHNELKRARSLVTPDRIPQMRDLFVSYFLTDPASKKPEMIAESMETLQAGGELEQSSEMESEIKPILAHVGYFQDERPPVPLTLRLTDLRIMTAWLRERRNQALRQLEVVRSKGRQHR